MKKYNHKRIEKKWQEKWESTNLYRSKEENKKEKKYILNMFPYPSGEGIHVGHLRNYIPNDAYVRYLRLKGFNVLHPMGWDAFGLPAEGYALKNKTHPQKVVKKNVKRYKKQLSKVGLSYDWNREINTTEPEYYKWTQWIFLQLFKKGLAFESNEPINWCPSCKTGLANEDLEEGHCERCDSEIEQKPVRQWVLKITDYAEKLLKDLDLLKEWPHSVRESQRNWIGKSEGVKMDFPLSTYKEILIATNNPGKKDRVEKLLKSSGLDVTVFTPKERGIKEVDVSEGGRSLFSNAKKKALTYREKTNLPILAGDTGFYIKGEKINPIKVKRNAITEDEEKKLSKEQVSKKIVSFYTNIAKKHGGEVEAYWEDVWVLLTPEGEVKKKKNRREVILTTKRKGEFDPDFPLRGLYRLKQTGEHIDGTSGGETKDFDPVKKALTELLTYPLSVFTTRPDTLYGATYIVIAPEHKILNDLWSSIENKQQVKNYIKKSQKKTEMQRTTKEKNKTGVEIKGIVAVNPINNEKISVWIADYVLSHYGTGAIMAVPAHDERDFDFATKKGLPIRYVIIPKRTSKTNPPISDKNTVERRKVHAIIEDSDSDKILFLNWNKFNQRTFIVGEVNEGEDIVKAARREIEKNTGYTDIEFQKMTPFPVETHYYAAHKDENIKSYTSAVHFKLKSKKKKKISKEEQEKHEIEWLKFNAEIVKSLTCEEADIWNEWLKKGTEFPYSRDGILINSEDLSGVESEKAKEIIRKRVNGKKKITYKLKDWVFSRQRYWGEPIPLIHCEKCGVVPIPEKDLPLKLPDVKSYEPTGTEESPLANISSWVDTNCPNCKGKAKRETNTMPQWAGSCWYYLRFIDPKNKKEFISPKKEKYWMPVDLYVGGVEHATRHLIYSRFWHKFLYDEGKVTTKEPFTALRNQGLILGPDGRKMSKRWGNVISPDDILESFGADAARVYIMFMGPFEGEIAWNLNGPVGARRFLEKVWRLSEKVSSKENKSKKLKTVLHKTIKKVEEDLSSFSFNTAISSLMILVNSMEEEKTISTEDYKTLLVLLSPFAPHITEELWEIHGEKRSIHKQSWPRHNPKLLLEEEIKIVLQINGKTRGTIELPRDSDEKNVLNEVKKSPVFSKWNEEKEIKKVFYVPNRIINIIL